MKRRGGIKPPFNLGLLNLGVKILFLIIITVTFITTFRRKNIEGMENCYLPNLKRKEKECKKIDGTTYNTQNTRCYVTNIKSKSDCDKYEKDNKENTHWWDPEAKKKTTATATPPPATDVSGNNL